MDNHPKVPSLNSCWPEWLVYADWLTEHDDVRGELLVLGSRLADNPKDESLREEIDRRVWTWNEQPDCDISDEDGCLLDEYLEMAKGFQQFKNIALPKEFSAPFLTPSTQILATLPSNGNPDAQPSSAIDAHMKRIQHALITWIDKAFDGVTVPEPPSRTLYQAEAEDNYQRCDRSQDHLGRWQDLPEKHLLDCQWSLPYLDEQGIQYYYPAIMCFHIRYGFQAQGGWLLESFGYQLTPTDGLLERFLVFTWEQRRAIAAYALASGIAAFDSWLRVALAEKDGQREDWFAIWTGVSPNSP